MGSTMDSDSGESGKSKIIQVIGGLFLLVLIVGGVIWMFDLVPKWFSANRSWLMFVVFIFVPLGWCMVKWNTASKLPVPRESFEDGSDEQFEDQKDPGAG